MAYNLAMSIGVNKYIINNDFYLINRKLAYYFEDQERIEEVSNSTLIQLPLKNFSYSDLSDLNNYDKFKFDHSRYNWYKNNEKNISELEI